MDTMSHFHNCRIRATNDVADWMNMTGREQGLCGPSEWLVKVHGM